MGHLHPLHILLAEDNAVNQKVALSLLGRIGYRADVVANGQEAIDALHRQPYDVILMDGHMPEMDGMQATLLIRQQFPAGQQPHIVAMTADALQGDRERYLAAGMNDYLSKPIRLEDLVRVLRHAAPGRGVPHRLTPLRRLRPPRCLRRPSPLPRQGVSTAPCWPSLGS